MTDTALISDEEWFDAYDGPKSLGWGGNGFHCSIGWNERNYFGIQGRSVVGIGDTPRGAIMRARAEYARKRLGME